MNILAVGVSLAPIDIGIIVFFFIVVVGIGILNSRSAGKSSADFFLGGRSMPWWLLGISMVACTFAADTPNLVAGLVREDGVSKNWLWWSFLITGMVTVFIYAKLWRRSNVMTDLEFYELRYGGKPASFLRGFRAIYLGTFFNIISMSAVTLAVIKYGSLMFGLENWECVLYGSLGVVIYATLGGIKGCIWADFFQYGIAMFGAVYAAFVAIGEAGKSAALQTPEIASQGAAAVQKYADNYQLSDLLRDHRVVDKLSVFPDFSEPAQWVPLLLMPLAVQWWAAWYPGAEPGGGGYIAQRMLAAKDEKNAIGATLFFNFAHYALRPWPWIIVALASLVCFPMDDEKTSAAASTTLEAVSYAQLLVEADSGAANREALLAQMETMRSAAKGDTKIVIEALGNGVAANASLSPELRNSIAATQTYAADYGKLLAMAPGAGREALQQKIDTQLRTLALQKKRVSSIADEFPHIKDDSIIAQDIAYPAMISKLEKGFLGIVIASIIAAYMSTIGTLLNWGASYTVNDFYKRFIKPEASEKDMVRMGRICTVGLMTIAGVLACFLESATQTFNILLLSGAGSGAIYLLRWFWWRVNAWSEIFAMAVTTLVSITLVIIFPALDIDLAWGIMDSNSMNFLVAVAATTVAWIVGTYVTRPESTETLREFYRKCHPGGPGWKKIIDEARAEGDFIDAKNHGKAWEMPREILCVFVGCVAIYAALFGIGSFIYGNLIWGTALSTVSLASVVFLFKSLGELRTESETSI